MIQQSAYYAIDSVQNFYDGIDDETVPYDFVMHCLNSEFQFLSREEQMFGIVQRNGQFPDLLYSETLPVPVASRKLHRLLSGWLSEHSFNPLFCAPVLLQDKKLGIEEPMSLVLPPKLECLAVQSVISEDEIESVCIDPRLAGNYQIFKVSARNAEHLELVHTDLIVRYELKAYLEQQNLTGIFFRPVASI